MDISVLSILEKTYSLTKDDYFVTNDGQAIVRRQGIDKIEIDKEIKTVVTVLATVGNFSAVRVEAWNLDGESFVAFATAKQGDFKMVMDEKGKESLKLDGTTSSHYVLETAIARGKSKAVLKAVGLYGEGVFSEDESEDFVSAKETKKNKANDAIEALIGKSLKTKK